MLADKKNRINPTTERIKKIHMYNEIKEIASTVFEKNWITSIKDH